jgi:hypothetical protein
LDDILDNLGSSELPGRPVVIPEGSTDSKLLGEMALKDKEHWDMPFPDLAKELGILHSQLTIEGVMDKHHNIFRCKTCEKAS